MSMGRKMDLLPTERLGDTNHDCNQMDSMIVKNRLISRGNQISLGGGSRNNEDVNRRSVEVVESQPIVNPQRQQWQQPQAQAPQGPAVRWESFLPFRSLKVLLVENDDSTRHVVSALLRNCSYEVRAVSNGLEAWIILQDLTNHVDLVLTEVAMPGLSGIDLLSKIMSHKTCKNVPVIMMSSNDSMGVVFKCLSNGAVDFLVKPIRKNELKNLWQHVWRKCHSSSGSGSGSESGIQTGKSTKLKSVEGSDNNSDNNDAEDSESTGMMMYKNGSDNDSGIQSSCSKRALEVPSHPISQGDDLADPPGSSCAQVIRSRLEAQSSYWMPSNVTKKFQEENDESDDVAMGKDLTIGAPKCSDVQLRKHTDTAVGEVSSTGTGGLPDIDAKNDDGMQHKDKDAMIAVADVSAPCRESVQNEVTNDPPKATKVQSEVTNDLPKATKIRKVDPCDEKEPSLELSLQRLRDEGNSGSNAQGHNILKHSDHSAFSRYNTTSTTNQAVTVDLGNCSAANYSFKPPKTESLQHLQGQSTGTPNQGSNGSSNSIDMGSTTNNASMDPKPSNDEPIPRSSVSVHHCYTYEPGNPDATKKVTNREMAAHQHTQVEHHHHHHYHHHHHHVHSSQQQKLPLNGDDPSSRNLVAATSSSVPPDKLGKAIEGNVANYGSASESNNGQNRKGTSEIAEPTNMTNDNGSLGSCAAASVSLSGFDQDRLSLREAALNKFRQKRKERCFEKKVRYQSRKMLAEQRPRVRGQFVRQATDGSKNRDESNDTHS